MASWDAASGAGQRGCSRWMVYAGAAGVMVLMLFLFASTRVVERGLDGVARRACARLLERLPTDLPRLERERTERNLALLDDQLRRGFVEGRVIGGFLSRASDALEDGRLTVAEVAELNRFLDGGEAEVATPPAPTPSPPPPAAG